MALVLFPSSTAHDLWSPHQELLKAFVADGLFLFWFPAGFGIFGFYYCWVFCLEIGRCFRLFVGSLYIYSVAVFSSQALGVGFEPGARSTGSTALTMGRTGRRFSQPYLRMPVILEPTASAFGLSYEQQSMIIEKMKKKIAPDSGRTVLRELLHYIKLWPLEDRVAESGQ